MTQPGCTTAARRLLPSSLAHKTTHTQQQQLMLLLKKTQHTLPARTGGCLLAAAVRQLLPAHCTIAACCLLDKLLLSRKRATSRSGGWSHPGHQQSWGSRNGGCCSAAHRTRTQGAQHKASGGNVAHTYIHTYNRGETCRAPTAGNKGWPGARKHALHREAVHIPACMTHPVVGAGVAEVVSQVSEGTLAGGLSLHTQAWLSGAHVST